MIEQMLFWVFAILACGGAVAVVATQNVVRMAFWLVVSLGSVAALFFLLHADFLGAAQLLIYVGGTVVLLVFGVMLTASGPYVRIQSTPADAIFGAAAGGLLLFVLISTIHQVDWSRIAARLPVTLAAQSTVDKSLEATAEGDVVNAGSVAAKMELNAELQQGRTVRQLGLGFLGLRPDRDLKSHGAQGLTPGFLLPFEIVSIHLLVVLVGAAYLARAKRRAVSNGAGELN
jgi:NADH:ubiquinone oxidoreductase subunit 6 (subunit J)